MSLSTWSTWELQILMETILIKFIFFRKNELKFYMNVLRQLVNNGITWHYNEYLHKNKMCLLEVVRLNSDFHRFQTGCKKIRTAELLGLSK